MNALFHVKWFPNYLLSICTFFQMYLIVILPNMRTEQMSKVSKCQIIVFIASICNLSGIPDDMVSG